MPHFMLYANASQAQTNMVVGAVACLEDGPART
jgi:hypothetical protein